MADPILDALEAAALGPRRVKGDAGEVEQYDLADLIEADRHVKAQASVAGGGSAWGATRPARVVLPSAIGPRNTETE